MLETKKMISRGTTSPTCKSIRHLATWFSSHSWQTSIGISLEEPCPYSRPKGVPCNMNDFSIAASNSFVEFRRPSKHQHVHLVEDLQQRMQPSVPLGNPNIRALKPTNQAIRIRGQPHIPAVTHLPIRGRSGTKTSRNTK